MKECRANEQKSEFSTLVLRRISLRHCRNSTHSTKSYSRKALNSAKNSPHFPPCFIYFLPWPVPVSGLMVLPSVEVALSSGWKRWHVASSCCFRFRYTASRAFIQHLWVKQQSKGTNHWRIVRKLIVRMKIKIGCMDKQNSLKYKFKHSDVLYYVPDNSQVTQDAKNKASK